MSYILDALKKSDQERQQNSGPNLQTVQRPLPTKPSSPIWKIFSVALFVLLFFSIVVGTWFYLTNNTLMTAENNEKTPAPALNIQAQQYKKSVDDTVGSVAPSLALLEFWQLPDTVQQELPAMTFSFHVYSKNPERRTIIINKQRVREASVIADGLVLEEITEQGVILKWKNEYRYSINVVENW